MKLIKFSHHGEERYGIDTEEGIRVYPSGFDPWKGQSIQIFNTTPTKPLMTNDDIEFLPPMRTGGKIVCVGLNYRDHAAEGGHAIPTTPAIFLRLYSSITGHNRPILKPLESDCYDYEAELAIIVGQRTRRAKPENALDAVLGYSCFNDGSLRDYQRRSAQWTLGKNFDHSGSLGPSITTADSLSSGATGLGIRCRLNERVLQDGDTAETIFSVAEIVAAISEVMTLEPGDVICTGTPAGVGFARTPPIFMQPGDICEVEIEGIGILRNTIAAD